jgi:thiol-disulfide isomerase/thioredoxin
MKLTIIIIVALVALLSGLTVHSLNNSADGKTVVLADISLPDTQGKLQNLSQWQGKTLVINFWATWCPPCLTEIPDFIAVQKAYRDKNVQFIGIAIDRLSAVKTYQAQLKINYPILIAEETGVEIAQSWGNRMNTIPFTVILNPNGQIIHSQMGPLNQSELITLLN